MGFCKERLLKIQQEMYLMGINKTILTLYLRPGDRESS